MAEQTWKGIITSIDEQGITLEERTEGKVPVSHIIKREFGGGEFFGRELENPSFKGAQVTYTIIGNGDHAIGYRLAYTKQNGETGVLEFPRRARSDIIIERLLEGTLMQFTDDELRISGMSAPVQHPFGNYGKDLVCLTKGLERMADITYTISREPTGANHELTWLADGHIRRLSYFEKDGE